MPQGYKFLNIFFSKNKFIGSYLEYKKIPVLNKPEICFWGRSNVGKSSLINKITKSKNLAKISKTPGRTQSINLFSINDKIIFADLPGYGFAKFSKTLKLELYELTKNYIEKRKDLKSVFLLIDGKLGIKESDFETISFLGQTGISFLIILTKMDKCSKNLLNKNEKDISNLLANYRSCSSTILSTSSIKNIGIANVQKNIYSLNK